MAFNNTTVVVTISICYTKEDDVIKYFGRQPDATVLGMANDRRQKVFYNGCSQFEVRIDAKVSGNFIDKKIPVAGCNG